MNSEYRTLHRYEIDGGRVNCTSQFVSDLIVDRGHFKDEKRKHEVGSCRISPSYGWKLFFHAVLTYLGQVCTL